MKIFIFYFLLISTLVFGFLFIDTLNGLIRGYEHSYLFGINSNWNSIIILSMFLFTFSLGSNILYSVTEDQLK